MNIQCIKFKKKIVHAKLFATVYVVSPILLSVAFFALQFFVPPTELLCVVLVVLSFVLETLLECVEW